VGKDLFELREEDLDQRTDALQMQLPKTMSGN